MAKITANEVARRTVPRGSNWRWFGKKTLLYLDVQPERPNSRHLFEFDAITRVGKILVDASECELDETAMSIEESLRRERARQMGVGVSFFDVARLAGGSRRVFVPTKKGLCIRDDDSEQLTVVLKTNDDAPFLDPKLSPDGESVSFVQKGELNVLNIKNLSTKKLTYGSKKHVSNGLADFLAQEEMDRYEGYWWSPDSSKLAFEHVDSRKIPDFQIMHSAERDPDASESHRYPFAGGNNPLWALGLVDVVSGRVQYVKRDALSKPIARADGEAVFRKKRRRVVASSMLTTKLSEAIPTDDSYLCRVHFCAKDVLMVETSNRIQNSLRLIELNLTTQESTLVLEERSTSWVNLNNDFHWLGRDDLFVWVSESSNEGGFATAELRSVSKGFLTNISNNEDHLVVSVESAFEFKIVYVGVSLKDASSSHVYQVELSSDRKVVSRKRLSSNSPGTRAVVVGNSHSVLCESSFEAPMRVSIVQNDDWSDSPHVLITDDVVGAEYEPPTLTKIVSSDGEDELYTLLYKPDVEEFGTGPWPCMVMCYGGPHVQLVRNDQAVLRDKKALFYTQRGVAVLKCDNRGSKHRGRKFEAKIFRNMGEKEVFDQVRAVEHFVELNLIDPSRVGVTGWSYGGYLSLLCRLTAPFAFKFCVSGAPVTHWDGYDTHYTERYMGTPMDNPDGYSKSSVMSRCADFAPKDSNDKSICLVHGMLDENVHFRHTARLLKELIKHSIAYELLVLPEERHSPRRVEVRAFVESETSKFALKRLLG